MCDRDATGVPWRMGGSRMIHVRGALRIGFMVLSIALVVASFVNVFGDDDAQRKEAEAIACPGVCPNGTQIAIQRTPFSETVAYTMPKSSVTVSCSRAAIFVGPWSCKKD